MNLRARATAAAVALPLALGLGLSSTGAAQAGTRDAGTAGATLAAERTVPRSQAGTPAESVLIISVDGLNPAALSRLGARRAPNLHRLERGGASTRNARTTYESTSTLPNHTGMVTGRRMLENAGGHGVDWNDDRKRPRTVHRAARERIESIFSVVDAAGGRTALFASKPKFTLFDRSWPGSVDRTEIVKDNRVLVRRLVRDLRTRDRALRFVHLSWPDSTGHKHGYMSREYVRTVGMVDELLGRVLATVEGDPERAAGTVVLLTSDHGGARAKIHDVPGRRVNYRVPFFAYGPGIPAGADLYDLNPAYADPGRGRPNHFVAAQPVRNIAVGNLALDLLGLPPVPGSSINAAQDLVVRP